MTRSCMGKNSRTSRVRGYRRTSWKTWDRNSKYSRAKIGKDEVQGKTKCICMNRIKKNSWQFAFNILCNVFHFLFENLPLNKTYNVFSSCYSMYSASLVLSFLKEHFLEKSKQSRHCWTDWGSNVHIQQFVFGNCQSTGSLLVSTLEYDAEFQVQTLASAQYFFEMFYIFSPVLTLSILRMYFPHFKYIFSFLILTKKNNQKTISIAECMCSVLTLFRTQY